MKDSFPCVIAQGPTGPYEVLHAEAPSLFAVELDSGWQMIAGDAAGLHRLAFLAGVVATRHGTVVHLRLRPNPAPDWVHASAASPGLLDLVLAPYHVALRPKEWRTLRARKPTEHRRVVLPPLERLAQYPRYPLGYYRKLDTRGMDGRVGAATLILSGDRTTFLGLAREATIVGSSERNGDGAHFDRIMRGGDPTLMLELWDLTKPLPST